MATRSATTRSQLQRPWAAGAWGGTIGRPVRSNNASIDAAPLNDGAYATIAGQTNFLYLVEGGRRRRLSPPEVQQLRVRQEDILEVEAVALLSIPEAPRGRAIDRNLQTYLWSDLNAGHFMQSWVWLEGTQLTLRTITETVTWFGGYTGGVTLLLFDANGQRIDHQEIRYRYGVDGRAFGSGSRQTEEVIQLPQIVTDAAESIVIMHYWDPKVDLVEALKVAALFLWDLLSSTNDQKTNGEPINAGGQPFP
jgi:hypothetical protein